MELLLCLTSSAAEVNLLMQVSGPSGEAKKSDPFRQLNNVH